MSWFQKIGQEKNEEENPIIYLSPEALQHVHVMPSEEFESFQNSPEFVPGGRLMEVSRQYSYTLRKVAVLREETVSLSNNWKVGGKKDAPSVEAMSFSPEPIDGI
ncbi:MAG: hypothetical protein HQM13_06040 [SAR324 cluster bacterium]|nr:hypothetical protein [SAR324 cluster bacterium]